MTNTPGDMHSRQQELQKNVQKQVRRMKQAEKDRPTLLQQSIYLGTIGFMFVLPLIGGAYLGLWLDGRAEHYEWHWTVCLILLGLFVGVVNVYLFVRKGHS
ncbi:MAG TPA: AtpZ/AtpI family protein [Terriglobales bacterium]|nr:AtpZ/AtpI family protein [Terriglobales bacterium]